jgi:hypothetical protein
MNDSNRRLERLELVIRPLGCPTCRHWDSTVIGDDDGNFTRPEACPTCGRFVPYGDVVMIHGVSIDLI